MRSITYKTSDLISDGRLSIGDGFRAKNRQLTTEGLPFLRAANLNNGFSFDGADRVPEELYIALGDKLSQPGDTVFTSKGSVGRLGFVQPETPRFVYSPQLCYWRSLDHLFIAPRYLYYWMCSRDFSVQWRSVADQTDMAPYVSLRDQRRMVMSVPPLAEQEAIAEILGALDDKIELNRKMNATLDELARTIFRSWFVDFDPVRAKMEGREPFGMDAATAALFPDRLVDSPLGPIPEGWEVKALDEIGDFLNGLALQKYPPRGDETDLPAIKIAQLRVNSTVGASMAGNDVPAKYVIENGDFLFSWSGSLLADIWTGGRGALNQHLFKVASTYPQWFIYHWVQEHIEHFRGIAADKATTMGHINRHHLSAAKCVVPDSEQMLASGDRIVGVLMELALQNSLESRTLAELRDTLLPELISGRIRVPEAERLAAGVV